MPPSGPTPEDHHGAIFEFSDDAILTKDLDAKITSWNPGAERIYGYSAEEAVGKPIAMLVPKHRAGEEREILGRVLAGERVDHYETERVTKDGRTISVSLTVSPIRNEAGVPISACAIARDVTEQQRSRVLAERLQEMTATLARELTPSRTITCLLEQTAAAIGADAAAVGLLDEEAGEIEIAETVGHDAENVDPWTRFPLDAEIPMARALRDGEPIWLSSRAELTDAYPSIPANRVRFEGLAVLPLTVEPPQPWGPLAQFHERSEARSAGAELSPRRRSAGRLCARAQPPLRAAASRVRAPFVPRRGERAPR